jgi:hypothetical protein
MCQQFEGEKAYLMAKDMRDIRRIWAAHESGERVLSPEEIHELCVRKLMLEDV